MNFSLTPFSLKDSPQVTISGTVKRQNNNISISYIVAGNIEEIYFPPALANPTRKDNLWKTTCFEFFIAAKDSPGYWEFNLSPSGEWNVYIMDAYRQVNMREETRVPKLELRVQKEEKCFVLEHELNLDSIMLEETSAQVGIASVIAANTGQLSYWALTHPHAEADFHLRNSFVIEFPAS